ncbi:hypothetical protein BKA83DRAFT_4336729 [Pisolithus microcarpus]|nr:hypothetical protein BKA83DRAFT_4336729 [Pisolithus microcarpus]
MVSLTPPQNPPRWDHTPEEVVRLMKDAITKYKSVSDEVAALPSIECNFNTARLADAEARFDVVAEPLTFYQNVAMSKELRDSSTQAEQLQRDFGVEESMRLDVFQAKIAAEKNLHETGAFEELTSEQQRLVKKMVLDGKRAGLALPEEDRTQLMALQKELSQVVVEFMRNFNEEDGHVTFTRDELEGVPEDVTSGYTKRAEGDKEVYDVTFKTPDIFPVFRFAVSPTTRQKAYDAHESRLAINVPLLERALDLRRRIASVLGYKTWADYVTEVKMVKTGDFAQTFVDDLEAKLRPVGIKEREILLALKKDEHEKHGFPFDGEFYIWDYRKAFFRWLHRYYDRLLVEKTLSLDDSVVKEYFPVSVVIPTILSIYQNLLGVKFVEITGEKKTFGIPVQQYAVWERDANDDPAFVGYCYLDLFPRTAKYSHAAVWGLLPGYDFPSGDRHYPLTAMVANLAKPTPERPALMRHDDVTTFFHEMGHVFHGLLSRTQYSRFHGTAVARDFVEAPSQMLENWCWERKVLEKMSSHYENQVPLSPDLIEKIIQSRYVNVGLFYLRQLFFAKFDLKVHTDTEPTDYTKLWTEMRERISLVKSGEPKPGQGSFGHIVGGYDAGYYGYTYSLVFAADMYRTVFKRDPLDPMLGQLYRSKILLPGGSRDEMVSLEDFLGRPPNSEAFLDEIFGSSKSGANANL